MKRTAFLTLSMFVLASVLLACSTSSGQQDVPSPGPESAGGTQVVDEQQKAERLLPDVNVPEIELLTPFDGVGTRPKFEWKEVDGAASYSLMLFDANGDAYWAWMGKSSYVYLGGTLDAPPEDSAGPTLQPDMRWAVAAFDTQDHLLATSVFRPISP